MFISDIWETKMDHRTVARIITFFFFLFRKRHLFISEHQMEGASRKENDMNNRKLYQFNHEKYANILAMHFGNFDLFIVL